MNFSTRISSDCTNKYCVVVVVVVFAFVDAAVIVFVIIILNFILVMAQGLTNHNCFLFPVN